MKERLREEWRATSRPARVVLVVVGAVALVYGSYMVLFWLSYDF